tara:strand:+ start:3801 stop:6950 length:3150 start_codon:yes stop_codon:yes gene_type:complete
MRIAHISDTHIRNFDRQEQYKTIFESLYKSARENKIEYIIHTGDIAHMKTSISPEFVEICSGFLRNLTDIAPTYLILGNHDGNLRNSDRQDALTPIVDALSLENLFLLKNSGEYSVNEELTLNVLSVFDTDNWVKTPSDDSKINIALYHGGIRGSQTDIGWDIKVDHDTGIFNPFDYAMLGDIHKSNQVLDSEGRIRYAGSTIQQDHGETPDKGYLIWDIKNKQEFSVEHIVLPDPNPHLDITLTPSGDLPEDVDIPVGSRARIIAEKSIGTSQQKKILDVVRKRFSPQRVTFKNKNVGESARDEIVSELDIGDLKSLDVQEKLIREYLKDYNASSAVMGQIIELNARMNTISDTEDSTLRNVNWSVDTLCWDNLFNYGSGNKIDFAALNGIIGIFGKNYSGKSSVIDSLLFTLENSTSKSSVKNVDIINQNKKGASSRLSLTIGNVKYLIERKMEKYTKKLKGKETDEAKMTLDFSSENLVTGEERNLNGETRGDTDNNIRKIFGTKDDFMTTSFSSQMDSLQFINQGSVDRKKILSKFLGLDLFERRYKIIKEESSDTSGALKQHENIDYDENIFNEKASLSVSAKELTSQKRICTSLKGKLRKALSDVSDIEIKIASYPKLDINIDKIRKDMEIESARYESLKASKAEKEILVSSNRSYLDKIDDFVSSCSYEDLRAEKDSIHSIDTELSLLLVEHQRIEGQKNNLSQKVSLLREVPCGDKFPGCKFLHDAVKSRGEISNVNSELISLTKKTESLREQSKSLDRDKVFSKMEKYEKVLKNQSEIEKENNTLLLEVERKTSNIKECTRNIDDLEKAEREYFENEKDCKLVASLLRKKKEEEKQVVAIQDSLEECENNTFRLIANKSSYEERISLLKAQKKKYEDLKTQNVAYELLKSCMDPNGISSDITKKYLPVINEEINKVLLSVVPFEVFFELQERKLDIYIRHPKYEPRVIEMASGAEKTLAAMAIRLALTKVGTLPKSDIFILDEPATDLDSENMEGFLSILEMLKSQFKTIILISHLDTLKECVDDEIIIDKKNGFASVNI